MLTADSLWLTLEEKVHDDIVLKLGAGSGIDDEIQNVTIGEIWNPEHETMPSCLIHSFAVTYAPEASFPHGDGTGHVDDMAYEFDIYFFLEDATEQAVRRRAIVLLEEFRQLFRQEWMAWAFRANSGEYLRRVEPLRAEIQVRGMGGHKGVYLGSSMFSLLFYSSN